MRCPDARAHLAAWSPRAARPIGDDVALHLDGCPACRGWFDAVFTPVDVPVDVAVDRLVVRVPAPRRWPALAAAAALLLVLGAHRPPVAPALAATDAAECPVGDELPVEAICEV